MHELKFIEAAAIKVVHMEGATLHSPACQKVLASFQRNMHQLIGTIAVPAWSSLITTKWADACTEAQVLHPKIQHGAATQYSVDEFNSYLATASTILKGSIEDDNKVRHELEFCTNMLESLVMRCGPFIHDMFHDQLKLLCSQAWTAIEVLIEDLHVFVLEETPSFFSAVALERHQRGKQNLKGAKFTFRSREKFRDAYEFAFGNDAGINAAIQSNDIDAIVVVRNLLVHRDGVADLTFVRDDLAAAPQLGALFNPSLGKPINFDGVVVRTIIDAAASRAYELIRAIDRWSMAKYLASLPK